MYNYIITCLWYIHLIQSTRWISETRRVSTATLAVAENHIQPKSKRLARLGNSPLWESFDPSGKQMIRTLVDALIYSEFAILSSFLGFPILGCAWTTHVDDEIECPTCVGNCWEQISRNSRPFRFDDSGISAERSVLLTKGLSLSHSMAILFLLQYSLWRYSKLLNIRSDFPSSLKIQFGRKSQKTE